MERGGRVMLYGDHSYADLADVTLLHGWHNVLLIMALQISKMNIDQFKWGVICQQFPMALIEDHQGA